jgi:predicted CDP-diglyceride synthetase/phosphatidate cytidylyltransferase
MSMSQPTAETGVTIVSKVATAATYTGSAGAIASGMASDTVLGLTTTEWSVLGVIGGLVIALLGFAVNIYFKRQHLLIAMKNLKADFDE